MSEINEIKKKIQSLELRLSALEDSSLKVKEKKQVYEPTVDLDGPAITHPFVDWIKKDWLMKLGALLLFLGLGWFVTYAFAHNWIGPIGRITLGLLFGAGLMAGGKKAFKNYANPGKILMVLGGSTMILSMFAARYAYSFFTPTIAFLFILLVVVLMAFLAVLHDSRGMALSALVAGVITPVLLNSPEANYLFLLGYMFVLNIATLMIAYYKGWRSMTFLALIFTSIYATAFHQSSYHEGLSQVMVWLFMFLYFSQFLVSNLLSIWRTKSTYKIDLLNTVFNGGLLLYWVSEFVPEDYISLILSVVTILLVTLTYFLDKNKKSAALYLHMALSVLFLGAATAFELDGEAFKIAFIIESLALVILSAYGLKRKELIQWSSLTAVLPTLMIIESFSLYIYSDSDIVFSAPFFSILILILSLLGIAWIIHQSLRKSEFKKELIPAIVAGFFSVRLIWVVLEKVFESLNVAHGFALVIYSIIGLALWIFSDRYSSRTSRIVGNVLLLGVVLRLLMFEVWQMPPSARIVTFIIIGALLISTAFLEKRK